MKKILILFAHPALEKSRVHKVLLEYSGNMQGVTINDLYQHYPEFDIDIDREQELLLQHDIIVWQHPMYWYSSPAMLKQWQDLVLEHGWAYGHTGQALKGKSVFNAISSGGPKMAYQINGLQRSAIHELLSPFENTATLCRMRYLPPFWIPGTHKLANEEIIASAKQYRTILQHLVEDNFNEENLSAAFCLNDLVLT